jgi:lathosterol oxidase
MTKHPFINGAANHTLHHLYFNYNYGQYFTLWDRIGGSYRKPTERQYDRHLKTSAENRKKEAMEVETLFQQDQDIKETAVEYLQGNVLGAKED